MSSSGGFLKVNILLPGIHFHIINSETGFYLDPRDGSCSSTLIPPTMWFYIPTSADAIIGNILLPGGLLCTESETIGAIRPSLNPGNTITPKLSPYTSDFEIEFDFEFHKTMGPLKIALNEAEFALQIENDPVDRKFLKSTINIYLEPNKTNTDFNNFISGVANLRPASSAYSRTLSCWIEYNTDVRTSFNIKISKIGTIFYVILVNSSTQKMVTSYINFKDSNLSIDRFQFNPDFFQIKCISGVLTNFIIRHNPYSRHLERTQTTRTRLVTKTTYNLADSLCNCFAYNEADKTIIPLSDTKQVLERGGDLVLRGATATANQTWDIVVREVNDTWPYSIDGIWQSGFQLIIFKGLSYKSASGSYQIWKRWSAANYELKQSGTYTRPAPDLVSLSEGYTVTLNLFENTFNDSCGNLFKSTVRIPWYYDFGGVWEIDKGKWVTNDDSIFYIKCPYGSVGSDVSIISYDDKVNDIKISFLARSDFDTIQGNVKFKIDIITKMAKINNLILYDSINSAYPLHFNIVPDIGMKKYAIDVFLYSTFNLVSLLWAGTTAGDFVSSGISSLNDDIPNESNFKKYSFDVTLPSSWIATTVQFAVDYSRDGFTKRLAHPIIYNLGGSTSPPPPATEGPNSATTTDIRTPGGNNRNS